MRRIGLLVVGLLVLGATPASAGPDVVEHARCGDDAAMRLELKDMGDRIRVRVVCRSPVGHAWRMVIRQGRAGGCFSPPEAGAGRVVIEGTRLATGRHQGAAERSGPARERTVHGQGPRQADWPVLQGASLSLRRLVTATGGSRQVQVFGLAAMSESTIFGFATSPNCTGASLA
jgi:hypothetical protein